MECHGPGSSLKSLEGAVALVTGARGAIGRVICNALNVCGARVIATARGAAPNDGAHDWVAHDVTSEADWRRVAQRIRDQYGRLDCLVNSAGVCPIERITDTSLELWRKVAAVNVESILLGMQACLPLLIEAGKDRAGGSSIVNLSSVAGLTGVPFAAAYCASKAAVTLLTKTAAKEFAALKYPVRVNSVHPSSVESSMMDLNFTRLVEVGWCPSIEAAREKASAMNPMGRLARPEEIASGIAFLCSPESSYINGTALTIDGGATA